MNKEHIRLLPMFAHNHFPLNTPIQAGMSETTLNLSFLHPVKTLIITIRDSAEMNSTMDASTYTTAIGSKGYFNYHGGGKAPLESGQEVKCLVQSIKLNINGHDRHKSVDGLDRDYLLNRIMPRLHSNTSNTYSDVNQSSAALKELGAILDRKEIYVFPFALQPEGSNPSGALNFSKVSHAKLTIKWSKYTRGFSTIQKPLIDVYAMYYNWLQIKDGRGMLSFA